MPRATLRQVAAKAGVHPATASRALNEETESMVNSKTAARIKKIAKEMGYTANPIARSLKTSRSSSIGLLIPDLTNPLFPPIVRGIEDVLRPLGYIAWIVNTDNRSDLEELAIQAFQQRNVEGLIIATARLNHPLLEELTAAHTPLVLVNRRTAVGDIPSVTSDDRTGVRAAMKHLADLGHTHIIHLAGPQNLSTGVTRRQAFRASLDDLNLPAEANRTIICDEWNERGGAGGMQVALASGVEFTAILAGNDLLALGALDVMAEHGMRCPDDFSLVGFNDMPMVDKITPPLTTVRIPHYDMGAESARLVLDLVKEPDRHPHSLLLAPTLVIRESTACLNRTRVPESGATRSAGR